MKFTLLYNHNIMNQFKKSHKTTKKNTKIFFGYFFSTYLGKNDCIIQKKIFITKNY